MEENYKNITNSEIILLNNKNFLIQKHLVIEKIGVLFNNIQRSLKSRVKNCAYLFPEKTDILNGKISRGEKYRLLPWMVLDYPRFYFGKDIFVFRSMFWWGNEFSFTLHLQGIVLDDVRKNLLLNIDLISQKGLYICVNNTPWEYHFEKDNYIDTTELSKNQLTEILKTKSFIKLSKRLAFDEWDDATDYALQTFDLFLNCLK